MGTRRFSGNVYYPTSPRSGSTSDHVFRMQNFWKRGSGEGAYHECCASPQNLSETVANTALTGTIALTANLTMVVGTLTLFTTELHLGQFFLVVDAVGNQSFLCAVERIVSDTSLVISRAPSASVSGKTGYRLPIIFAVDNQRGTALRGNVVKLDKGTLFSVGDGTFRLDGSAISATLALSRTPKASILTSSTYAHYTLGMSTPAAPTVASVAGGTKGMIAAQYSIRVTPERLATLGFNNPSLPVIFTLAAGGRAQITFAAVDSTHGEDAHGVWGTRYVDSQDTSGQNTINGPWFRVGQVAESALDGSRSATFEWLDGEIETQGAGLAGSLLTYDNDAPPNAEFVVLFNGVPVWISTDGVGDTSPGPFIRPAKPSNIEAAPAGLGYPTSPPELILGVVSSEARLYLLTTNHLQIAQPTSSDLVPVRVSPFWKTGFKNPYQLIFINGVLYGATNAGPVRSSGSGDSQETENTWATPIAEFYKSWVKGHILVAHDPLNDAVVFFHSGHSLNSSGFWATRWWAFGLTAQEWIGDGLFSSTTRDQIVSGVATVGNNLDLLMGGRKSDNTVEVLTYRFDTGSDSVSYYLAMQFSDSGDELRAKQVGGFRVTGKVTNGSLKVYGARPTEDIPVSDLAAGTNALATLSLSNNTSVKEGAYLKAKVKDLKQHTVRIEGTFSGSGDRDRIEEIVYEYEVVGSRK
jgi:hypothetical protein